MIQRKKGLFSSLYTGLPHYFTGQSLTFFLQVAILVVAVQSVEAAGWVDTPPLSLIAFLAVVMAAILVKRPRSWAVHHMVALGTGALVAYLAGVYLAEGQEWYLKFNSLHTRLAQWWTAILGEDATNDTLPLSMVLIALTWSVSYFTSWALFMSRNVWVTLLPIGAGIVVNLTYLPERFLSYFFAYLVLGLLLTAHITTLKRQSQLASQGVSYPPSIQRLSMAHGLWLSAIAVGLTIAIPVTDSVSSPLRQVFKPLDRSVDSLRNELHRIFASVPGHKALSMRFFGSILPLVRPVPTGEEPIFSSTSPYPLFWRAKTYQTYTSKAWKTGDTELRSLATPKELDILDEEFTSPDMISYMVDLYVDSPYILISGSPVLIDPQPDIEVPATPSFQIELRDPSRNQELPPDLRAWIAELASSLTGTDHVTPQDIPQDILVREIVKEAQTSGHRSTTTLDPESDSYQADLAKRCGKMALL